MMNPLGPPSSSRSSRRLVEEAEVADICLGKPYHPSLPFPLLEGPEDRFSKMEAVVSEGWRCGGTLEEALLSNVAAAVALAAAAAVGDVAAGAAFGVGEGDSEDVLGEGQFGEGVLL